MNHRLDNHPQSARHKAPPSHRAQPPLAATKRHTRRSFTVISVLAAAVVAVPTALAVSGPSTAAGATPASVTYGPELVVNGGFESGTTGWRTNTVDQYVGNTSNLVGSGSSSAVLTRTGAGNLILNDTVNTVASTTAGTIYDISAMVRATGVSVAGQLKAGEFNNGTVAKADTGFKATNTWQTVTLTYTATGTGNTIDLNVFAPNTPAGAGLAVDLVSMRAEQTGTPTTGPGTTTPPTSTTPTSTTPTSTTVPTTSTTVPTTSTTVPTTSTTVPTTTTSTTPPVCVNTVNGIPPKGSAYVGAAAGGTQTYQGLEAATGMTLREHRTYFTAGQVSSAVKVAQSDLAAGRLPWMSFKLPYSWAAMANGTGDAWAIDLTQRLAVVGGPVWIAFHHEPEYDNQPIQDWVRMQQHLAPIIHAYSNNIAFTVIFSSWNVTYGNFPLTQVWPGAGVDILGIDIYNNYNVRSGKMMDPMHFIPIFRDWADSHGARWAIAESGYNQDAADIDPAWLDQMYNDAVANGAAAYSYFDSSLNSVANWTLDTAPKLNAFKRILATSTKMC